jgi:hypothetical protein
MLAMSDYRFTAFCPTDGEWKDLEFRELAEDARVHFRKVWGKKYQAVLGHFGACGGKCPDWATWKPDEWSQKSVDGRTGYAVWDGNTLAGFLNVRVPFSSEFVDNRPILYLEHVSTSPGNKNTPIWSRRMQYVGYAMMAFAILKSVEAGLGGIVGLHATEESKGFYATLNLVAGASLFHPEKFNVEGFHKVHPTLAYFETQAQSAVAFLESYRNDA